MPPPPPPRRSWGGLALIVALVVMALIAVVGWRFWGHRLPILPFSEKCLADVGGHQVTLTPEQARHASLIAAIAGRRGLPARAVTIALATAMQESKLLNLEHGDRDSLGLFQQRPSQGWGTQKQILDPTYSTNAFYDHLVRVPNYRKLEITVAAQTVQRSAYPDAYAQHEEDARALASALTGNSKGAFWCDIDDPAAAKSNVLDDQGLTPRAAKVRQRLAEVYGDLPLGGFEPGGVTSGHMPGSSHYEGRALDIFVRPISKANKIKGWSIASYLVANASDLNISTVIFDDRVWQAGAGSGDGWRDYDVPSGTAGDRRILEHRDHVHVNVAR